MKESLGKVYICGSIKVQLDWERCILESDAQRNELTSEK